MLKNILKNIFLAAQNLPHVISTHIRQSDNICMIIIFNLLLKELLVCTSACLLIYFDFVSHVPRNKKIISKSRKSKINKQGMCCGTFRNGFLDRNYSVFSRKQKSMK